MDSDDRKDIVVNHVHPGYVDTDMTRSKSLLQGIAMQNQVTNPDKN